MIQVSANIIRTLQCSCTIHPTSGGIGQVRNSDSSYIQNGASPIILPDETYNIYVNGVLDQTITSPALKTQTINISP